MPMRLDTKRGDKIVFANPNDGWPSDTENARQHLVVGMTYTVALVTVSPHYSYVHLAELPNGPAFNTVQFNNCGDERNSTQEDRHVKWARRVLTKFATIVAEVIRDDHSVPNEEAYDAVRQALTEVAQDISEKGSLQ